MEWASLLPQGLETTLWSKDDTMQLLLISRQICLTQWKLMEWGICDDHRTGILQPCDKLLFLHLSTPLPKWVFFHSQLIWICPSPGFLPCSSAGLPVNFPVRVSSGVHFSSYWRTGTPCFYLVCSALPITAFPRSPVFIPPNKYIDCIKKKRN